MLEWTPIVTEHQADPGGIKETVRTGDAVDEGVHGRAGDFVDRHMCVFQTHRRFKDEEVVVAGVVEVDGAALSHHWHFL